MRHEDVFMAMFICMFINGPCTVSTWTHHEPMSQPARGLQHHLSNSGSGRGAKTAFFVNRYTCSEFRHTQCPCYTNAEFFVLAENDHDKPTTVFHLQIVLVKTVCPKLPPVSLLHVYKPAGLLQLPRHDDQILKNATCLNWQDCSTATAWHPWSKLEKRSYLKTCCSGLHIPSWSSSDSLTCKSSLGFHRFTHVMVPSSSGRVKRFKSMNMRVHPKGIFSKMRRHFMTTLDFCFLETTGAGRGSKTKSFKKL